MSFVCLSSAKKIRLIHRDQVRSGSMGGEIEIKSARKKWLKSNIKNAIKTKRTPENIRNAYVLPRPWFFFMLLLLHTNANCFAQISNEVQKSDDHAKNWGKRNHKHNTAKKKKKRIPADSSLIREPRE